MSENRRNKRLKKRKKTKSEKNGISKRSKIILISGMVIFISLICLFLFIDFLKYFITID